MLCLSGFELYSRSVPLQVESKGRLVCAGVRCCRLKQDQRFAGDQFK